MWVNITRDQQPRNNHSKALELLWHPCNCWTARSSLEFILEILWCTRLNPMEKRHKHLKKFLPTPDTNASHPTKVNTISLINKPVWFIALSNIPWEPHLYGWYLSKYLYIWINIEFSLFTHLTWQAGLINQSLVVAIQFSCKAFQART